MITSVSPIPLPVWPMLGLSLALVTFTAAAVTLSAHRAAQIYPASSQTVSDATAPTTEDLTLNRVAVAVAAASSAY